MDIVVGIGISAGILAGLFGEIGGALGIITWVSFIAWLCFFAAGAGKTGLAKAVASNIFGLTGGFVIVKLAGILPVPYSLGISIVLVVFIMVVASKWSVLSFIPGSFAGCSSYFGANSSYTKVLLALLIGAILGYLSEQGGIMLTKIFKKKEANVKV
ncbi:DUF1097 domain-containing protein [Petroclostridium sp. X23]|uniref:DUF1097 domain-containing protein n=1 Tax=Petroclostridium sp. X23 TaxID=3045146 RepID=UPI0024AD91A1|nr:DUF1097 domain-containing protein [Petroclostridium sp. X23]WHH57121.1 DUF1097 domain-containing protein [Petroclostridium sp. X23]